jgi:hypothetical protein
LRIILIFSSLCLLFLGCSAATGSRYETKEVEEIDTNSGESTEIEEKFDITPYRVEIDIEAPPIGTHKLPSDVWYGYNIDTTSSNRKITGTAEGYRVQVLSTDDIDEANSIRAEIYEKTTRKEVYVVFEPPFYKVKVGDFTSKSEAENLRFKLTQLGYTEAKVVQETVNLFE